MLEFQTCKISRIDIKAVSPLAPPEDLYPDYEEDGDHSKEPVWVQEEVRQFVEERDVDKNGFLEGQEIADWLVPLEIEDLDEEVEHLIEEADEDEVCPCFNQRAFILFIFSFTRAPNLCTYTRWLAVWHTIQILF